MNETPGLSDVIQIFSAMPGLQLLFLVLAAVTWLGGGNILVAYHYRRVGKPAWSGFKPFAFPFRHFNGKEWLVHVRGIRDVAEPAMRPNNRMNLTALRAAGYPERSADNNPSHHDDGMGAMVVMRMVTKPIAVLIVLLFAALRVGEAQSPPPLVRVGFLSASLPAADRMRPGLVDGLRLHGYAEGQNLIVETRYAEGRFERLSELAAELVRLRCDVIVAAVTQASLAARDATATIPIVMIGVADPVAAGLVASLARPGGNVTGTSGATTQVVGKQLELLKETFPDVTRVAVLWNPANRVYQALQLREAEIAARALRVELQLVEARKPGDLERSFASIATRRPLLLMGDPLFNAHRRRITELATARRVPIVTSLREYAEAGALFTYGPNITDLARRSAVYVDRILKGAKPADLPVEQPTKFELVINLKTAKALGLTIPPSLLLRTDQIID